MDDVDGLEGQALADAVAREVMGWELRGGPFPLRLGSFAWWHNPDGASRPRSDWYPMSSWSSFGVVVEKMAETHHWVIKSPFAPGAPWFIGLIPHGVTGWNGRPDAESSDPAFGVAGCRAALKAVRARRDG